MNAYAHTHVDEETINLTNFSSVDKLLYGLKDLSNFLTKQISLFVKTLNKVLT